ncbi:MAG: UvrD-helicase domain-containing protein, partial [Bdellovibrionales bacterium]
MTDDSVPPSSEKTPVPRRPDAGRVQRRASDPSVSAWVTASAGTGKTKVLTDRVLRLMLEGAKPDEILCLTFTRAAAAVMTIRIREELSLWATCPDEDLNKRLKALTGEKPDDEMTATARRLFAKFLDTHGGLRIQTIHAFAQDLIRRFPVETKVPPYFDVMDDQTAADLLREAQADVLQETQQNPHTPLARAVRMVTPEVSEEAFADLMGEITYRRGELLTLIDRDGGVDQTIAKVYAYLGVDPKSNSDLLQQQLNSDFGLNGRAPDIKALEEAAEILAGGSAADLEKAQVVKAWLMNPDQRTEIYKDYRAAFVTKDGEIRKKMTSKAAAGAEDALRVEADRLLAGDEIIRTHNAARGTESLLRLSDAVLERYTARKKALNLLDFDDLV